MAISPLNLPWLTDPHDLQGIPTPTTKGPLFHHIYTTLQPRRVKHFINIRED
jgi:hypothetical protein